MSAGVAVKHSLPPRHLALDVHDAEPSVSHEEKDEEEKGPQGKGFMFGSLRRVLLENGVFLHSCDDNSEEEPQEENRERKEENREIKEENEKERNENDEISTTESIEMKFEADLQQRLRISLKERDDQWREHEKRQIRFLQEEQDFMLKFLHKEIERLRQSLREAQKPLAVVDESEDKKKLEKRCEAQEEMIQRLQEELRIKEEYATNLEGKVTMTIEKLREQNELQGDRIRQLSSELNDRNQTVAHLSAQLRSYRLRDAMATAQQRRRASQGSPLVSPTSPHRVFPPKGLVSASVMVTYPGSKSSMSSSSMESGEGPGSIERPPRRRSSSGFGK